MNSKYEIKFDSSTLSSDDPLILSEFLKIRVIQNLNRIFNKDFHLI